MAKISKPTYENRGNRPFGNDLKNEGNFSKSHNLLSLYAIPIKSPYL
jgi:hypothetical protein